MSSSTAYVSDIVDDDGRTFTYRQMLIGIRDKLGIDMRLLSRLLGISSVQLVAVMMRDETCRFANRRCERNIEIAWRIVNGTYDCDTSRGYGMLDDIKQAIVAAGDLKPINGPVLSACEMLGGE